MGWRGKLICLLIFYFAGFATAIYCLTPVPQEQNAVCAQQGFPQSATKSDQFAKSFSVSLRKFIGFTKSAASETITRLKQKRAENLNNAPAPQSSAETIIPADNYQ